MLIYSNHCFWVFGRQRISILIVFCLMALKAPSQTFTFDLEADAQGWLADWADYPIADSVFYELETKHSILPSYILPNQKGIYIKGNNHSDDLFMFLKKKLTGLLPNRKYSIVFQLQMASNAPTNAVGVGGNPDLAIKVGAAPIEPLKIKTIEAGQPYYILNIDKGDQNISGTQMVVIGTTGVSDTTTRFTLINRRNTQAFFATTNANGELWAIVGTESAFEGLSELYYSHIVLTLSAVTSAEDVPKVEKINVYPNPANAIIFVDDAKIFDTYDINDMTGRLIKSGPLPMVSGQVNTNSIDISFLATGQYILRLKHADGTMRFAKFVKVND